MEEEIDIILIDVEIKSKFIEEIKNVNIYKDKLAILQDTYKIKNLSYNSLKNIQENITELNNKIQDILSQHSYNFYIFETASLLDGYKKILKTPIVVSFFDKPVKSDIDKRKKQIIQEFLKIAKKYTDIKDEFVFPHNKKIKVVCKTCGNKNLIIDENMNICTSCGTQYELINQSTSYKDIDRINISMKYTYDRIIHFRDCINQYQGKQNSNIDKKVYDDLEDQFDKLHLLVGDKNTPRKERFKNITKDHINIFLKELGYTKHYENVNLIHYKFTDIPPDDISHLENKLMDDFICLTELYDKRYKQEKKISRKNFINTQYVLFQLLNRHKHPCKKEDFNILKTIERQSFHDEITKELFEELGWNMVFLI